MRALVHLLLCFVLCIALEASQDKELVVLTVREPSGINRYQEAVTSGVPFPIGLLATNVSLSLEDESGNKIPLQYEVTGTWRDGSVKWVLLDFQATVPAAGQRRYRLLQGSRMEVPNPIIVEEQADRVVVLTGPLQVSFYKKAPRIWGDLRHDADGNGSFEESEYWEGSGLVPTITAWSTSSTNKPSTEMLAQPERHTRELRMEDPEEVRVEEAGPMRSVIKTRGWFSDGEGNRLVEYICRTDAFAGSSEIKVQWTVIQMSDRLKMLWVRDWSLWFENGNAERVARGPYFQEIENFTGTTAMRLLQLEESEYSIEGLARAQKGLKHGGKVSGWGWEAGVRHFWQQYPKAIEIQPQQKRVRFGLNPAEAGEPFDMDQGLAKTHEITFTFGKKIRDGEPLFAVAPVEWNCETKVFGDLAPFNFDLFPEYETMTEAAGDQMVRKLATGLRNWGDIYYGGEYKGKNAYMNLEYDVPHNFLVQFARTGLRKYLDPALAMAMHQADIDINHKTKWQWKHSPRHVEIQAEFGHTFTRGLLETYFLTGNRRCLEAAVELGDYFSKAIRNPRELGNERQIGWSLISLLPVYEATWDRKYFQAAKETVDRLLAGLEEKGKFSIRWDNRIAFFNGIGATGFIYYYRATGDERVAEAALKVIRRTKGMLPEYAGRTLEALAWAYERTGDADYLEMLVRTYETTIARQITWNSMELSAPTIFTVHALPFLAKSGLVLGPERPLGLSAAKFATEDGRYAHHLPDAEGDIYLEVSSPELFDMTIVRKGTWKGNGKMTFYRPDGSVMFSETFPAESKVYQQRSYRVEPGTTGPFRLQFEGPFHPNVKQGSFITWDVATSKPLRAVLRTPDFRGLEFITPKLFTKPGEEVETIEIKVAGEGEGFKKVILFDPEGNTAAASENFIDLGDRGRYFYTVTAQVPPKFKNRCWSISLQETKITRVKGLLPYFSCSEGSFFSPEKRH